MNASIADRLAQLARYSRRWRQLASGALPAAVNNEIVVAADEIDIEIARITAECLGKRTCPCGAHCKCRDAAEAWDWPLAA